MRAHTLVFLLALCACSVRQSEVPCRTSADCGAIDPKRPLCDTSSGMGTGRCVDCVSHSAPQACLELDGGTRPICDRAARVCRGCQANGECASGLCRSADSSVLRPGASSGEGECVAEADIAYVDVAQPYCETGEGDGGRMRPYCQLGKALAATEKRPYVVVRKTPPGKEFVGLGILSGDKVVVGPGRDANEPAVVKGAVFPAGSTASLVFDGMVFADNVMGPGVLCGSAGASVTLRRSLVRGNTVGVQTTDNGCKKVVVDRSAVLDNNSNGIFIGSDVEYEIVNSLVAGNVKNSGSSGVVLSSRARGTFSFNTVTGNKGGQGRPAACSARTKTRGRSPPPSSPATSRWTSS